MNKSIVSLFLVSFATISFSQSLLVTGDTVVYGHPSDFQIESHLYVRRIEIPILHIVGKLDGIFEFEDSFIPWNELIGTNEKDKTIIILENVGHGLPKDLMIENHLKFLKKYN